MASANEKTYQYLTLHEVKNVCSSIHANANNGHPYNDDRANQILNFRKFVGPFSRSSSSVNTERTLVCLKQRPDICRVTEPCIIYGEPIQMIYIIDLFANIKKWVAVFSNTIWIKWCVFQTIAVLYRIMFFSPKWNTSVWMFCKKVHIILFLVLLDYIQGVT